MPKRMDGTETWFRVQYEVEYDIRYRAYNKNWDHTKPTTGEIDGDNPMYVYTDDKATHEHFTTYLGPYNSMTALEREAKKFEEHYAAEVFQRSKVTRGVVETAKWEEV